MDLSLSALTPPAPTSATFPAELFKLAEMSRSQRPGPTASATGASSTRMRLVPCLEGTGTSVMVPEVPEPISVTGSDPLVPSPRSIAEATDQADPRPVGGNSRWSVWSQCWIWGWRQGLVLIHYDVIFSILIKNLNWVKLRLHEPVI